MAVAVLPSSNPSISHPFLMATSRNHARNNTRQPPPTSTSPSARSPSATSSPSPFPHTGPSGPSSNAIRRLFEHTFVRRTRPGTTIADEATTITDRTRNGKEKEKERKPIAQEYARERPNVLQRIDLLRRGGRDRDHNGDDLPTRSRLPISPSPQKTPKNTNETTRTAIGSMRGASMSSPMLLASTSASQTPPPPPPPKSEVPNSPTRNRTRASSIQQPIKGVSGPLPLPAKRPNSATAGSIQRTNGHRSTNSTPAALPSLSTVSLLTAQRPPPHTPSRPSQVPPSPPHTPTPSGSKPQLYSISRRPGAPSSTHLPFGSQTDLPQTVRGTSPVSRSPSSPSRVRPTQPRGIASVSTSHLPPSPITPTSPGRASVDSQRRLSNEESRTASPSSPNRSSFLLGRQPNTSTITLSQHISEYRGVVRTAIRILCKELVRPPSQLTRTEHAARIWEELEVRMRPLVRLERMWVKNPGPSTSQLNVAIGEEKERRMFGETLKDGFVLCLLMNKLRSSSILRPDTRDGASNVTKFLAACASYGLSCEDLFQQNDLQEASAESLVRVAKTIIALVKHNEAPPWRAKVISGQGGRSTSNTPDNHPYSQGTVTRAALSTPNLLNVNQLQRSRSPTSPPSPVNQRRYSPSGTSLVRSNSPEVAPFSERKRSKPDQIVALMVQVKDDRVTSNQIVPMPPPRSPLRPHAQFKRFGDEDDDLFTRPGRNLETASVADSTRVLVPESARTSLADTPIPITQRQSIASGTTETTSTTVISSLLDIRINNNSGNGNGNFGTVRTMTTDVTSEAFSFARADDSPVSPFFTDDMTKKRRFSCERRLSEAGADLVRVPEESEEGNTYRAGGGLVIEHGQAGAQEKGERSPIHLGKAKWPDDFFTPQLLQNPIQINARPSDRAYSPARTSSPITISPPRKPAIPDASQRHESLEFLPEYPRRPLHRPRHSADTSSLLPKESVYPRDGSPDSIPSASNRIILRRHSTNPNAQRNGIYLPRANIDNSRHFDGSGDSVVPFPRTVSGGHSSPLPSPTIEERAGAGPSDVDNQPHPLRGRFQSNVEESSFRRPRPSSYDELGARPPRARFESMVNLGVATSDKTANDLMSRGSMDGSPVRKTFVVKEQGKPPTQFQLGNCIGRGQFGSVYKALNLNTGHMVAVKRICLKGLKEDEVTQLMKEVDLVKSLSHPSIVKYEGMARDADTLSIVLEFAENGSLGQTLKLFGKLNERLIARYVVRILEGLDYLHQSGVVHCDLKAANILTTKSGNVKLSDFGVSLNLRTMVPMERESKDVAGTPNWMAPEVIELKGASPKSDIWSLGCTVIELLTGRPPYAKIANGMTVMFRIVEDNMPPLPGCSPLLRNFLMQCLQKDPEMRPSAAELREHPWLKLHAQTIRNGEGSVPVRHRAIPDYQQTEASQELLRLEIPKTPMDNSRTNGLTSPAPAPSPSATRDHEPISPRDHSFVETSFGRAMPCRVCLLDVKKLKKAVICETCSLISHKKCSIDAPPTCNLRAQLLLYAQYAEKGDPGSIYSNPAHVLHNIVPKSPASDVPYVTHTPEPPRTSPDTTNPPTSFKFLGLKWATSRLTPEPVPSPSTSLPTPSAMMARETEPRTPFLRRKDRPQSLVSNSTSLHTSSTRSAATAAESFSSRRGPGGSGSTVSAVDPRTIQRLSEPGYLAGSGSSRVTNLSAHDDDGLHDDGRSEDSPGSIPAETGPQKKRNKDSKLGACIVQ